MSSCTVVEFLGDTRKRIRGWPAAAKQQVGWQLESLQAGEQPSDFKPMPSVGPGVEEIRVWDDAKRIYRVIYTARFANAVYVLHAFQKTSQKTEKRDIALARRRLAELLQRGGS
jgi:phage-related protein